MLHPLPPGASASSACGTSQSVPSHDHVGNDDSTAHEPSRRRRSGLRHDTGPSSTRAAVRERWGRCGRGRSVESARHERRGSQHLSGPPAHHRAQPQVRCTRRRRGAAANDTSSGRSGAPVIGHGPAIWTDTVAGRARAGSSWAADTPVLVQRDGGFHGCLLVSEPERTSPRARRRGQSDEMTGP